MHNLRVLVIYGLAEAWHTAAWWVLSAIVVGILLGSIGAGLSIANDHATRWIVNCLGLLIGARRIYSLTISRC